MIDSVLHPLATALVILTATGTACAQYTPFVHSSDRKLTRVVVFSKKGVEAQCAISYGAPEWKEQHAAALNESAGKDLRWRLGSDLWTTLDVSVPIVLGRAKVPAGHYYVVLERTSKGRFQLVLLESEKIRKQKLDAFQAPQTTGGIELPLEHEELQEKAGRLSIELQGTESEPKRATLHVRFGPHHLSAPVELRF
jgi:hypothetical protein